MGIKLIIKFYHFRKAVLLFFIYILFIQKLDAQVCNSNLKSKYITLTEQIIGGNVSISALKSHSVLTVKDGFWIAGLATYNGQVDFYYAKFNDTGKLLFFKTTGMSNANEGGYSIKLAPTPSGGIILTGSTYESSINIFLGAVVSIDNTGTVKWFRKTANANNDGILDAIRAVMVEPNGDVIIAGDAQQYSGLLYARVLICKLDSNGNKIYNNQINISTTSNQQAHPTDIQPTPYGYLVGGWMTSNQNPFLLLIDKSTGKQLSIIYMPNNSRFSMDKLIYSPSGKVYMMGFTNINGTPDAFVMAVHLSTQTILWQKAIIPKFITGNDYFNYGYLDHDKLYMSMQTTALGRGVKRFGFIALDTNGNFISGNSVYFNNRSFETSNSAIDFNVLDSGGTVAFGQDDAAIGVRLNLAIFNPCSTTSCTVNKEKYEIYNTNLNVANPTAADVDLGDLTTEYPITNNISILTDNECYNYVKPIKKDTTYLIHHICNGDSILIIGKYRKLNGIFIDTSLKNVDGIDSIIIHSLFVHGKVNDTIKFQLCQNQEIVINGKTYSSNSDFTVTYKNIFGCDSIIYYSIRKSTIKANFDIDSSQAPKLQFFNTSTGNFKSYWDFGDATFDSTAKNPSHTYNDEINTAQICLIVTDSFGCQDTICKSVEMSKLIYWLLNSFSPGNNDGINDVFKIGHKGRNFYYDIMIYSRWGVLVYETQNASIYDNSKLWNGQVMNSGANCPAGSYFVLYKLYVDGIDKSPKEIHGIITLIRK